GEKSELRRIPNHPIEMPQGIGQRMLEMICEHSESQNDRGIRRDRRLVKLRNRFDEPFERLLGARFKNNEALYRFDGLDTTKTDRAQDHLVDGTLVHDRGNVAEPLGPVFEKPSRAPLLSAFLIGLREEENVAFGDDSSRLQLPHRERLRQAERLHVIGAAAVEIPTLDPAAKGRSFLPEFWKDFRHVDVIEQEEGPLPPPAGQSSQNVASPRCRADDLVLDPGAIEEPVQILGALQFPALAGGVNADVFLEQPNRLFAQPFRCRPCLVRRLLLRDQWGLLGSRAGVQKKD